CCPWASSPLRVSVEVVAAGWLPAEDGGERIENGRAGSEAEHQIAQGGGGGRVPLSGDADPVGATGNELSAGASVLVIGGQRGLHVGMCVQEHGQRDRVLQRLIGPLTQVR